jgi:hypothetical protein
MGEKQKQFNVVTVTLRVDDHVPRRRYHRRRGEGKENDRADHAGRLGHFPAIFAIDQADSSRISSCMRHGPSPSSVTKRHMGLVGLILGLVLSSPLKEDAGLASLAWR